MDGEVEFGPAEKVDTSSLAYQSAGAHVSNKAIVLDSRRRFGRGSHIVLFHGRRLMERVSPNVMRTILQRSGD